MIVMPDSFPYGGMENPLLTFVSPTVIVGDKSMINIIINEIVRQWTGNLVTNANWRNFWLNEGFSMFLQRKIIELVYGEDMALLNASLGDKQLIDDINTIGPYNSYTSLYPDIQHVINY